MTWTTVAVVAVGVAIFCSKLYLSQDRTGTGQIRFQAPTSLAGRIVLSLAALLLLSALALGDYLGEFPGGTPTAVMLVIAGVGGVVATFWKAHRHRRKPDD